MKNYCYYLLIFLLIIGCQSPKKSEVQDIIEWLPELTDLEKGSIPIPENHEDPESRSISLAYAILRAKQTESNEYPMIFLMGGPGANSLTKRIINIWMDHPIRETRDIILFDQRGIGYSSAIPNMSESLFNIMAQNANAKEELHLIKQLIAQFKQKCENENIGLRFYNSFQSASDIGVLMKSLPYEKYNLYGVSYGARLTRIVQDEYPDLINSVVLNSPSPMVGDFLIDRIQNYTAALDKVFQYHEGNHKYQPLKGKYLEMIERLKEQPIEMSFNGSPFYINSQDAIYLIRLALYRNDSRTKVPKLIEELEQGKGKLIEEIIASERSFVDRFNSSMWLSVERHEMFNSKNLPYKIDSIYHEVPLLPVKLGTFDAFYRAGMNWHNHVVEDKSAVFKISDIPTLITINEFDPVTPPQFGHLYQKKLPNSKLFILDEGGHAGGSTNCRNELMISFMSNPNDELDTSCLNIHP